MLLKVQGRGLACAEEERDVFHLYEWHSGFLESESRRWYGEIGEPERCISPALMIAKTGVDLLAQSDSIFEAL